MLLAKHARLGAIATQFTAKGAEFQGWTPHANPVPLKRLSIPRKSSGFVDKGRRPEYNRCAMPTVTLYGKPGCHLCEDARDILLDVRARRPFELIERNIEDDPALFALYAEEIPVVEVEGEVLSRYKVYPDRLEKRLEEVS